jgi:PAS domain S-box-containing protein
MRARLSALYGLSIYGALLLVVFGGLVIPAIIGSYLLIGVHEQKSARYALDEALARNADILALGMQESLWNMNAESAHSLVESVMRDRSVLQVQVVGQADTQFMRALAASPRQRVSCRARNPGARRAHRPHHGRDGRRAQPAGAARKQLSYVFVLAAQLMVSLLLIVLFLNSRLIKPLRKLMRFSDRLSHGDFETRLDVTGSDELGRLAQQEQMRVAIKRLFEDIGQREERFRTIVTQVPGAVFRFRPDGKIDFVSDAIEDISGYSAAQFMRSTTHSWTNLIAPEDRKRQRRVIGQAIRDGQPYEVEYRIVDAGRRALGAGKRPAAAGGRRPARRGWTASSPTSASASTMKCASKRCWPSKARSWTT